MEILTRDEIDRLSTPERLELIGRLWDSLEDARFPLTGAHEEELACRLASLDQGSP